MSLQPHLQKIADGKSLTREEAESAMATMMEGDSSHEETAAFLMGLRTRGETLDELVGFTSIMREFAVSVDLDDPHAIDLCGTGGDNADTFNISTTATFVCAGAGVTVAKHGNRSVSSKSGSADVLAALGVVADLDKQGVEYCLEKTGLAFIFAPSFHPAMKFVMPVRKALGIRTFFNILGPLCNPAGVKRQLVGAFNEDVAQTMAAILDRLGAEHVITAHAHHGLDELSLSSPTQIYEVMPGRRTSPDGQPAVVSREVTPEQHGLSQTAPEALTGGTAEENAEILRNVLRGETGPRRSIVELNAAYALYTSGKFDTLGDCMKAAQTSIDSGAAMESLEALIQYSQEASS